MTAVNMPGGVVSTGIVDNTGTSGAVSIQATESQQINADGDVVKQQVVKLADDAADIIISLLRSIDERLKHLEEEHAGWAVNTNKS